MDYDKLVEQRRRNWGALKPEEVRQKEKEEERARREEERNKTGRKTTGFHEARARMKEEMEQRSREEYRRVMRQVRLMVALFVVVIVVVLGVERLIEMQRRSAIQDQVNDYTTALESGEEFDDLSTPVNAFATWRSAWSRGDMETVVDLFSRQYMEVMARNKTRRELTREYRDMYNAGSLQSTVDMANFFDPPEVVRIPRKPWGHGDLAIFRSPYVQRVGEPPPGTRYIVAFSYDNQTDEWRYADSREAKFFNVRWDHENRINELRMGPNAVVYDEEGNSLGLNKNVIDRQQDDE